VKEAIERCAPTRDAVLLTLRHHRGQFVPQLPPMTKLIAKLTKQGDWAKALLVFQCLPDVGLRADTTVTNAALTACGRGCDAACAREVFSGMREQRLAPDLITFKAAISALCKGQDWEGATMVRCPSMQPWQSTTLLHLTPRPCSVCCLPPTWRRSTGQQATLRLWPLQAFAHMCEDGAPVDATTCMTLLCLLDRAGQWPLAEATFLAAYGRLDVFVELSVSLPTPPMGDFALNVRDLVERLRALHSSTPWTGECFLSTLHTADLHASLAPVLFTGCLLPSINPLLTSNCLFVPPACDRFCSTRVAHGKCRQAMAKHAVGYYSPHGRQSRV
jgi:Pentatricopeptide repeat domain